eukprot:m.53103 g.53103  ORF g.53103 m.53103 type:complete len:353 (+) comp34239_c0_seq27:251-1309(+)
MAADTKGDKAESKKSERADSSAKRHKPSLSDDSGLSEDELKRLEDELRAEEAKLTAMQQSLSKMKETRKEKKKPPPLVHPPHSSSSNGFSGPPPLRRPDSDSGDQATKKTKLNYLGKGRVGKGTPKGAPSVISDFMNRPGLDRRLIDSVSEDDVREAKWRLKVRHMTSRQTFYKQLERSFANVSSPRPPPDQWPLCPWAASSHFSSLLGLEIVVGFVQTGKLPSDQEGTGVAAHQYMKCSNCGLDFSPVWRLVRDAQKQCIVCEKCENSRIKQALLSQHSRRLQGAFSQAAHQEKEFEATLKQQVMEEAVRIKGEKIYRGPTGAYPMQNQPVQPRLVMGDGIRVDAGPKVVS